MRAAFTALCTLALSALPVTEGAASVIHWQPDGSGGFTENFTTSSLGNSVSQLLTGFGIDDPSQETTATTFIIPGDPGTADSPNVVDLRFTFIEDSGALNGVFGFFPLISLGDLTVGSDAWKDAAKENTTVIFDDCINAPLTRNTPNTNCSGGSTNADGESVVVIENRTPGEELGFILFTNGFDPTRDTGNFALFSDPRANPDGTDAGSNGDDMLLAFNGISDPPASSEFLSFNEQDITLFAFEDVVAGDDDFTDLVFTVTPELRPGVTLPPENVPAPSPALLLGAGLIALCSRRQRIR